MVIRIVTPEFTESDARDRGYYSGYYNNDDSYSGTIIGEVQYLAV